MTWGTDGLAAFSKDYGDSDCLPPQADMATEIMLVSGAAMASFSERGAGIEKVAGSVTGSPAAKRSSAASISAAAGPASAPAASGGGGEFGFRLAERQLMTADCALIIAGRSAARCERTIISLKHLHPTSYVESFVADRETVTAAELRKLDAFIVVDSAGPFQFSTRMLAEAMIDSSAGRCAALVC